MRCKRILHKMLQTPALQKNGENVFKDFLLWVTSQQKFDGWMFWRPSWPFNISKPRNQSRRKMIAQKWLVLLLPILMEMDVRLIHVFDLRYEQVRENFMIPFSTNGYFLFFFNKKLGPNMRTCIEAHQTVICLEQYVPPWFSLHYLSPKKLCFGN